MSRILKYIFYDLFKTRFILLYFSFLLISSFAMYQLDSDPSKVILSLMNILLLVVPLVSIVFSTIHFYNSYEFIELMLAQPVDRKTVFLSQYIGVGLSLSIAFVAGTGLPVLIYGLDTISTTMVWTGFILTWVFVSLAFLASVLTRDKAKAMGVAILLWFYFSLIYDAFLLWVVYTFGDYPLESPMLILISLNPVDLARVIMLLKMDISALMGYTGAFFKEFFHSHTGTLYSAGILLLWAILPVLLSLYIFRKKDI
ncbi:MAG TPA: ABC transporter permease subunit [Saprospiraceae bacterium]|nr:ABC transporter permease subunit [Saprospiraceae bacterium]